MFKREAIMDSEVSTLPGKSQILIQFMWASRFWSVSVLCCEVIKWSNSDEPVLTDVLYMTEQWKWRDLCRSLPEKLFTNKPWTQLTTHSAQMFWNCILKWYVSYYKIEGKYIKEYRLG